MSFRDILQSEKSLESLQARVKFQLDKDLERRPKKPSSQQIEAAIQISLDEAIATTVQKVSHWALTPDTFHDAFMMAYKAALNCAHQKLQNDVNSFDEAYKNHRDERLQEDTLNESQLNREEAFFKRQSSNLEDLQKKAMQMNARTDVPASEETVTDDFDQNRQRLWATGRKK